MTDALGKYDVIIIGSGPIGLTLANLLGTFGVRTLIIDRNLTTVQEPRAVSIDDESLRTMQAVGVIDVVLSTIVSGYGSHYYGPNRRAFLKVEPRDRPFGYPRRNAFRQPLLEGQLRDALGRFSHVEARYGRTLVSYKACSDEVTVDLASVDGTTERATSQYLIGCDGASSTVREHQGVVLTGTTFEERWLIVDLEQNLNAIEHTEVFCDPKRPCITLPGPDSTRRYEFKLLPGETDEDLLAPGMVQKLLRAHGADPKARIRRTVVYRFHARVASRWSFGRVFLAGDAAHLTPPFAGQGMNSGIRDAQNLAWKLAWVLRKAAAPSLLASYETERKDHVWQMIGLALRMGRVMSPRTRWHGLAIRGAFHLLRFWPPARDYVAQMRYKPPPRFKAGFLIRTSQDRSRLVGRMLPQPRVRCGDDEVRLLDDVIGPRFALLALGKSAIHFPAAPDDPLWDELDLIRVAILPKGYSPRRQHSNYVAVVEEDDTLDRVAARAGDAILLLRPDRYVMAVLPRSAPGPTTEAIRALMKDSLVSE